jgi:hypothetical protein
MFRKNISLPSSGSINKPSRKQQKQMALSELYGITTHSTTLFIAAAV